jgi:transcriptional regulator with XRE-family HTH domain
MPSFSTPLFDRGQSGHEYRVALGDYIRELRLGRGMTQTELAKAVGVSHKASISAIEVGRNVVPAERYIQFAEALGVPKEEFVEEILRHTNPWAHAVLFKKNAKAEFKNISKSLNNRQP